MPECYRHGRYSGTTCPRCEVADALRRSRQQAEDAEYAAAERERRGQIAREEAEEEARHRHWEAETAAERRARGFAEHQRSLVENAHTIQAASLCARAKQLRKAGMIEEALATCQDAIARDRGYLPGYVLMGILEHNRGNAEVAVAAFDRAIRLLGTAEWTSDDDYVEVFSTLERRELPAEVRAQFRAKAGSLPRVPSANLLTWMASFGWSEEVLRYVDRGNLSIDVLLKIATWLVADVAAGTSLLERSVVKLREAPKAAASHWLELVTLAMRLESSTERGGARRAALDLAASWSLDDLVSVLEGIGASREWRELGEAQAGLIRQALSRPLAEAFDVVERSRAARAAAAVPAAPVLLAWIPQVEQGAKRRREAASAQALAEQRRYHQEFVAGSILRGQIVLRDVWMVDADAAMAEALYAASIEHEKGLRLERAKELAGAAEAFTRARDLARAGGNDAAVQSNAHWRAWCLYELRAWEVAFTGFVEATRLAERLGNAAEVGANLYWQGMCLWHRDNPNRDVSHASALFDQSLETANELAEPSWFVAESHWMLALMAEEAKDRIAAKARFRTAAQHYSAASHQYQASALRKVAENSYPEVKPGDYTETLAALEEALLVDRAKGDKTGEITDLFELGCCHSPKSNVHGDWGKSFELLSVALSLAEKAGDMVWQARCLQRIAWCLEPIQWPAGDWSSAIDHYQRSADLAERAGNHDLQAEALNASGWCYQPDHAPFGDWDVARALCARAADIWVRIQNRRRLGSALFNVARSAARGDRSRVDAATATMFGEAASLLGECGCATCIERHEEALSWAAGAPGSDPSDLVRS